MEKKNIYQRMSEISNEVTSVAKNLSVGYGNTSYKAVSDADVLAAVKPLLAKHGVYAYPYNREIVESGTLERETKNGKSVQLFLRIKTTFRFINIDDPTDYIEVIGYGDGVDAQDKAPGKACTYSDKYCLLRGLLLVTGDDPDQYASEPVSKVQSKPAPKTSKEKMNAAYPDRVEMIAFIKNNYDEANLAKILKYYKVVSVEELTTEQLIVCYNKKKRQ